MVQEFDALVRKYDLKKVLGKNLDNIYTEFQIC